MDAEVKQHLDTFLSVASQLDPDGETGLQAALQRRFDSPPVQTVAESLVLESISKAEVRPAVSSGLLIGLFRAKLLLGATAAAGPVSNCLCYSPKKVMILLCMLSGPAVVICTQQLPHGSLSTAAAWG